MNYIYDVMLNFNDYNDVYDFYEWNNNDNYDYIDKMPIFVVNTIQMNEIMFSRIKISKKILDKIKDKTILENGVISYSFLVTNRERVLGLKFNSNGELIEISNLLLDEEEAVIDDSKDFDLEYIDYEIIGTIDNNLFLTRNEKRIRKYLLEEISNLYKNKNYDEINYLYYEIFDVDCGINNKYKLLINNIKNNYSYIYNKLYDVIILSKKEILSN